MRPVPGPQKDEFDDAREFVKAHEQFHDARRPSQLAILERAARMGSDGLRGIAIQIRRIRGTEPEDAEWPSRVWIDLQFLIAVLWRMRQAGVLALSAGPDAVRLQEVLAAFDAQLPDLKRLRDVAQHFDEYAIDGPGRRHSRPGRTDKLGRRMLDVGSWDFNQFSWLDGTIDFEVAGLAACELYAAITAARDQALADTQAES